jgi:hypothetical protein
MVVVGFVIPPIILIATRAKNIAWVVVAAILINVGMWVERVLIVVPSMAAPQTPGEWSAYSPTWVEWGITAGCFAAFALFCLVFSRLFPIVSVWEMEEAPGSQPPREPIEPEPSRSPRRVRIAIPAIFILLLAGATLTITHDAGATSSEETGSLLHVTAPTEATAGVNATLVATLRDAATFEGIPERTVTFSLQTTFGWLVLGENETGEGGVVNLVHKFPEPGQVVIGVGFGGDGDHAGVSTIYVLEVAPSQPPSPPTAVTMGTMAAVMVLVVVGGVWGLYAYVAWQMLGVALDLPVHAHASEVEPAVLELVSPAMMDASEQETMSSRHAPRGDRRGVFYPADPVTPHDALSSGMRSETAGLEPRSRR